MNWRWHLNSFFVIYFLFNFCLFVIIFIPILLLQLFFDPFFVFFVWIKVYGFEPVTFCIAYNGLAFFCVMLVVDARAYGRVWWKEKTILHFKKLQKRTSFSLCFGKKNKRFFLLFFYFVSNFCLVILYFCFNLILIFGLISLWFHFPW
jgi:hypothetical protein